MPATKTTALDQIVQAAADNGWTVKDLGEVTLRTPDGSFGRDGVTHVLRGVQIEWPEDTRDGYSRQRYLAFFKPSGAFHFATASYDWDDVLKAAAKRVERDMQWYLNANQKTREACEAHGVKIGVPFPKRKGYVPSIGGYSGNVSHQIVNNGKDFLVMYPFSEDTITAYRARFLAQSAYRQLGQSRINKTNLLQKLANNPTVVADRRRTRDLERAVAEEERTKQADVTAYTHLTEAREAAYKTLVGAGRLSREDACTVIAMLQEAGDNTLVALAQAAGASARAKATHGNALAHLTKLQGA